MEVAIHAFSFFSQNAGDQRKKKICIQDRRTKMNGKTKGMTSV